MREKTRDVAVGGETYRLSKWDPRTAVWVRDMLGMAYMQLLDSLGTQPQAAPEREGRESEREAPHDTVRRMWQTVGASLKYDDYRKVQNVALQSAGRVQGATTVPLLHANGGILPQEPVADDPAALDELVKESLAFNLSPFFGQAAASTQSQTAR